MFRGGEHSINPGETSTLALLSNWRAGDAGAGRALIARMQPELRKIAASYMARELRGNTLQPTAMVNELFVRLMGGAPVDWQNRSHFLAVASQQCGGSWSTTHANASPRKGDRADPPTPSPKVP